MLPLVLAAALVVPVKASAATTIIASAAPNATLSLTVTSATGPRRLELAAGPSGRVRYAIPRDATGLDLSEPGASAHVSVEPALAKPAPFAFVTPPTAFAQGDLATIDVRGFDPLHGGARVDGIAATILAASDRSVVAQIAGAPGLGPHALTLSSGRIAFTARVFVIHAGVTVGGPAQVGVPRPVTFTVDGLGDTPAKVELALTGDATFANGEPTIDLPVDDGKADTTMKAKTGYGIDLKWHLDIAPRYRLGLAYDVPEATPTPNVSVNPTPTPLPCTLALADGAFEAMQGIYQDDPAFQEKPDQLRREDGSIISYYGELDMVKGRPAKLVGVDRYVKDGVLTPVNERNHIFLAGTTNCSEPVAVKMRFTLYEQGAGPRILYTSPVVAYIGLRGYGKPRRVPWRAVVLAYTGVPEAAPFTFAVGANHYAIKAELIDDHDRGTGMLMWVNGYTAVTTGPLLRILPVVLTTPASPDTYETVAEKLLKQSDRIRAESYENIPDIYPLKPNGLPMPIVGEPIDLRGSVIDSKWFDSLRFDVFIKERYKENLAAALADRLSATTVMDGVGRTVAVMSDADFDTFAGDRVNGYTISTKLVSIRWSRPWGTVAHEIGHTLPEFLWSVDQMQAQCGKDYHNQSGDVAYGMQLTRKNVTIPPERRVGYPEDPMQSAGDKAWISQCTYANLLGALQNGVDPPILLTRFYLARPVKGAVVASFQPAYETQGVASAKHNGTFSLVARDAGGNVLDQERFEPQWYDDNGKEYHELAMQIRLRYDARIARLDLLHGASTLASMTMSSTAPSVAVDAASIVRRTVRVRWHGAVEAGRTARYTVFTSMDGRWYDERIFERPVTSAYLTIVAKRVPKFVRVVVTDGSRNAQATVPIR